VPPKASPRNKTSLSFVTTHESVNPSLTHEHLVHRHPNGDALGPILRNHILTVSVTQPERSHIDHRRRSSDEAKAMSLLRWSAYFWLFTILPGRIHAKRAYIMRPVSPSKPARCAGRPRLVVGTNETLGMGAVGALRFYKSIISPLLPPSCRFIPTCSE